MALMAIYSFLFINGYRLTASEPDAVATMRALAAGEFDEPALAQWIEKAAGKADTK